MILASFEFLYTTAGAGQDTSQYLFVDLDFRSLYQINPDHLITLKYAAISALRRDALNATLSGWGSTQARLVGQFNETRNIVATIPGGGPVGQTVVPFDGIAFNGFAPFVARPGAKILMPPTFQLEFRQGMQVQTAAGDDIRAWFTIGYDIELKQTRF